MVRRPLHQPARVGTVIVKPKRHVVRVADLSSVESEEMGVVLRDATDVVTRLESPEQVYVTLRSHAHAVPGHIHSVVQPVTTSRMDEHDGEHGRLQAEMFDRKVVRDPDEASDFARRARDVWRTSDTR
jgi:diadenosine tetraphosphate (Ap4A) HIT family hydrolase